jgi:cysteine synthase A
VRRILVGYILSVELGARALKENIIAASGFDEDLSMVELGERSAMKENIAGNVDELIGWTPLVEIKHITKAEGALARIVGKLEGKQPGGSVKDRIALNMILDAEEKGLITPGKTVLIEVTSGNTGVAIAMVARHRGYRVILIMPDSYSMERRILLRSLGAELILADVKKGIDYFFEVQDAIVAKTPNAYLLSQFTNPANPEAHFRYTGPEIWEATAGKVDIFVAGCGTGGTVTGAGRYLKSKKPSIQVVTVEPAESPVLSGGKKGLHQIQGIGAGIIPDVLDISMLDRIITVHSNEALDMARRLSLEEGLLVGISSGAAFAAALKIAKEPENAGKLIVVIFPSSAERYLSTTLFTNIKDECEKWPVL